LSLEIQVCYGKRESAEQKERKALQPVGTSEKFEQRFEKGRLWEEDGRKLAAMNVSCHRQERKGAWKT